MGYEGLMEGEDIWARGKTGLILGSGGTSNSTAAVCRDMGAKAV